MNNFNKSLKKWSFIYILNRENLRTFTVYPVSLWFVLRHPSHLAIKGFEYKQFYFYLIFNIFSNVKYKKTMLK